MVFSSGWSVMLERFCWETIMSLLSEASEPEDVGLGITSAEDIALTNLSIDFADNGFVGTVKKNAISKIESTIIELQQYKVEMKC